MALALTHQVGEGSNIYLNENLIGRLVIKKIEILEEKLVSLEFIKILGREEYSKEEYTLSGEEKVKPFRNLNLTIYLGTQKEKYIDQARVCYEASEAIRIYHFNK